MGVVETDKSCRIRRCGSISILTFALVLLLIACQPSAQERAQVEAKIQSCLLEVSDLPADWQVATGPMPSDMPGHVLPGRALGGVNISLFHPLFGANASQTILLYSSSAKAAREFERQQPGIFSTSNLIVPWQEPNIGYTGGSADAFRLACAERDSGNRYRVCSSLAQYDRFLSEFFTWVSPKYMTDEDLFQVLQAIDRDMTQCIDKYAQ
ncbi:MAG: hypothetical protein HY328_05370 [Chloroflexi bacterium]|nr:hypothetical protein [Chloroflexota bacterium]